MIRQILFAKRQVLGDCDASAWLDVQYAIDQAESHLGP
jgi:hypothetical protein